MVWELLKILDENKAYVPINTTTQPLYNHRDDRHESIIDKFHPINDQRKARNEAEAKLNQKLKQEPLQKRLEPKIIQKKTKSHLTNHENYHGYQ